MALTVSSLPVILAMRSVRSIWMAQCRTAHRSRRICNVQSPSRLPLAAVCLVVLFAGATSITPFALAQASALHGPRIIPAYHICSSYSTTQLDYVSKQIGVIPFRPRSLSFARGRDGAAGGWHRPGVHRTPLQSGHQARLRGLGVGECP